MTDSDSHDFNDSSRAGRGGSVGHVGDETIPPTASDDSRTGSARDDAPPVPKSDDSVPEHFGRYHILQPLGQGAMGVVYLAEDAELGRQVAIKLPTFDTRSEPELLERFYREARAAATLSHPNICAVYDVGQIDGLHYISMAYIDGRPLSDFISPGTVRPPREAAVMVRKLALALAEAHQKGIVHRDLKPGNIMVDHRRQPIITDFGLARQIKAEDEVRMTQTGAIMGSPAYMSPEQADPERGEISPASDVYSLGVVFYELLTGRVPFQGSLGAVLGQILHTDPPRPSQFAPELDVTCEAICLKMIAKPIADRYQSMPDVARVLTDYLKGRTTTQSAKDSGSFAGFEQSHAKRDARRDKLDELQQQARQLRKTGRYPAAIAILEKLAGLKDPRGAKHARWARKQLPLWKDEPRRIREQRDATVATARDLIERHDYQQALELLESVPVNLRTDEIQELLDQANDLHEEVQLLIADIDDAVRKREFEGLLPNVERLLELKPSREKTRKLYEQLTGHGPGGRLARGTRAKRAYQEGPWGLFSGRLALRLTLTFLVVFALVTAAVTLYVRTGKGTLQITLHDKAVHLSLDGESLKIENLGQPLTVRATEHELIVERNGLEAKTKRFTLKRGQKLAVEVAVVNGKLAIVTGGEKLPQSRGVPPRTGSTRAGSVPDRAEPVAATKPPVKPASASGRPPVADTRRLTPLGSLPRTPLPDGPPGEVAKFTGHTQRVNVVAFSPDGRTVASGSHDMTVRIWDVKAGLELHTLMGHTHTVWSIAFSPDSRRLASGSQNGTVAIWDTQTGRVLRRLKGHTGPIMALDFSPDGRTLASGSHDKTVKIWDTQTGRELRTLKGDSVGKVQSVAFSSDGRMLASGSKDKSINIWDIQTGRELRTLKGDSVGKVQSVAFSPDGQQIVSGSWDKTTTLWDIQTGRQLRTFTGDGTQIMTVAFLPDGRHILRGGQDKTLRLWNVETGAEVYRFTSSTHVTNYAAISPDGRFAVSGGGGYYSRFKRWETDGDFALRLWRLPKEVWPKQPMTGTSVGPSSTEIQAAHQAAEWVLRVGGNVTIVVDSKPAVTIKTAAKLPRKPFRMEGISLQQTKVTDAHLSRLKGLTNLQTLSLYRTKIGDAGLAHLKGLTKLRKLNLGFTRISNGGLVYLDGFTNLETLILNNTSVGSHAGLTHLAGLTDLQYLNLSYTQTSNASLAHLKGLTKLQTLYLNRVNISDVGLVNLSGLTKLQRLSLHGTRISNASLLNLSGLVKLQRLSLHGTRISNAGLTHLKGLTELKYLNLQQTKVTAAGVTALKTSLPNCQIIR